MPFPFKLILLVFSLVIESTCAKAIYMPVSAFECDSETSLICRNGGVCIDFSKLTNTVYQKCICEDGFYGPYCGYKVEMLETTEYEEYGVEIGRKEVASRHF